MRCWRESRIRCWTSSARRDSETCSEPDESFSAMTQISIGGARYQIVCAQRDGRWFAHAAQEDTGDPFGIECAGESESEAVERLSRWLAWQSEHAAALTALQQAERAYHRTIAGSAFANPIEGPTPIEMQRESLEAVEAARTRLDEVRARQPM